MYRAIQTYQVGAAIYELQKKIFSYRYRITRGGIPVNRDRALLIVHLMNGFNTLFDNYIENI